MAACDLLLENLDASCPALNKMGGVRKKIYYVPTEDIASTTIDPVTGNITAITLKSGKQLYYIEGKKFRHNAATELAVSENGPRLINQTVNLRAFIETQKDKDAVQAVMMLDAVTVILPLNSGKVEMYGYSTNGESIGLAVTAGGGGTGTVMGDDTSIGVTFSGPEHNLPVDVQIGDDFADTIAALDALVTTPTP
jgi:hypothetical protein